MSIEDDKTSPLEPSPRREESRATTDPASRTELDGPEAWLGTNSPVAQELTPAARPPVPEDLRVPWAWIDVLIFVFVYVVGTFAIGLLVTLGFGFFGINPAQIQKSIKETNLFNLCAQGLIDFALFAYLAVHVRVLCDRPFWRTIGWRPLHTKSTPSALVYSSLLLGGMTLGMMITLASSVFPPKGKVPIQAYFQDRQTALLMILMGILLAPLVEETLFRGYLYPVFARSLGVSGGVLVTGALFGLLHARQLWGGWVQIALLVVVGIVLTFARAATRSVFASYFLHLGYNSYQLIGYLIATHGLRHLPTP